MLKTFGRVHRTPVLKKVVSGCGGRDWGGCDRSRSLDRVSGQDKGEESMGGAKSVQVGGGVPGGNWYGRPSSEGGCGFRGGKNIGRARVSLRKTQLVGRKAGGGRRALVWLIALWGGGQLMEFQRDRTGKSFSTREADVFCCCFSYVENEWWGPHVQRGTVS